MRIVTDGEQYAVAWGFWIFTSLLDLEHIEFWWSARGLYAEKYCWGDKETILKLYNRRRRKCWTVKKEELNDY